MKKKVVKQRGGKRPGSGRKMLDPAGKALTISVCLTPTVMHKLDFVRSIAGGGTGTSRSGQIAYLIERAYRMHPQIKDVVGDVVRVMKIDGHRKRKENTLLFLRDGTTRQIDDHAPYVAEAIGFDLAKIEK